MEQISAVIRFFTNKHVWCASTACDWCGTQLLEWYFWAQLRDWDRPIVSLTWGSCLTSLQKIASNWTVCFTSSSSSNVQRLGSQFIRSTWKAQQTDAYHVQKKTFIGTKWFHIQWGAGPLHLDDHLDSNFPIRRGQEKDLMSGFIFSEHVSIYIYIYIYIYLSLSLSTYMQYMRRALFPALSDCCGSKKGRASFWYNMCWGGWPMASSWMLHMALSPRHAQAGIFCSLVQAYQLYEFFAGNANLSKCSRASGLRTAKFDILFDPSQPHHGSNCMDINSGSGFAPFGLKSDVELGYAGYPAILNFVMLFFFRLDVNWDMGPYTGHINMWGKSYEATPFINTDSSWSFGETRARYMRKISDQRIDNKLVHQHMSIGNSMGVALTNHLCI